MGQDTETMSSYTLGDKASQELVITFSRPLIAYTSSSLTKLQATITITNGDPLPSRSIEIIGYTGTNSIADGLDIVGNSVSKLTLQLDSEWPSDWTIQANGHTLSKTNPSIPIVPKSSDLESHEISIVFNFAGLVSGDPKIKVIPPS